MTKGEEAIGEQSATAAAAVAGRAEQIAEDAAVATTATATANQAKKVLEAAGETAEASSRAGDAVGNVVDASCRAHRSVSRQIHESPLMAILVGCVLGYVAGWWINGGRRPRKIAED